MPATSSGPSPMRIAERAQTIEHDLVNIEHGRPHESPDPACSGVLALHDLEGLRRPRRSSRHAGADRAARWRSAAQTARVPEEPRLGLHGLGVRRSQRTNGPADDADGDGTRDAEAGPAVALPRTRPQTTPNRPALARARPGRSRARSAPSDRSAAGRRRAAGYADGDVEPEDPLPAEAVDDGAADRRAERDGPAAHAAPDAERHAAAKPGAAAERIMGERRHDGGADALQRPRGDQPSMLGAAPRRRSRT